MPFKLLSALLLLGPLILCPPLPGLSQINRDDAKDLYEEMEEMRQEMQADLARNQALLQRAKPEETFQLRSDPMIQKLYEEERNGQYHIHLLIPDLEKGSFKAEARGDQLFLTGKIHQKNRLPQGGKTLSQQAFYRSLTLPPGVLAQEMQMEQRGPKVSIIFPKLSAPKKKPSPPKEKALPVI